MRRVTIRPSRNPALKPSICQFCQFSTSPFQQRSCSVRKRTHPNPVILTTSKWPIPPTASLLSAFATGNRSVSSKTTGSANTNGLEAALEDVKQEIQSIKSSAIVPSEERVVQLLRRCQRIVENLIAQEQPSSQNNEPTHNATSSLLGLEEKAASGQRAKVKKVTARQFFDTISRATSDLLEDEKVFISPDALDAYTRIHSMVKRADRFPRIFSLYANKPLPEPNTSPIKYRQPNPKSVKNAIPTELANMALKVAVEQKNLPLALAIIDSSFSTPAFYRAKLFKKAGIPLTGLVTAPLASYVLATWSANLQNTMDPGMATGIAFTAILAYMAFTSSVGLVAVATANDQMERVVWAPGVPLRYRWLREEERAALDKIAVAWGFKDPWRRGEEEGEEWESLREFIGMRGMILDKSDLMEGMQ